MKRLLTPGILLPLLLGVTGVVLIVIGQAMDDGGPRSDLPDIPSPTRTERPSETPGPSGSPTPLPTPTPLPDDVVAVQLEIQALGINVPVRQSDSIASDDFPPADAAFIHSTGHQPGRNTNSYIFAHALEHLFKPLWNARVGDQVLIRMSNGQVLAYVITEVRPNTPCPDPNAEPHPDPPLPLQRATDCDTSWLEETPYEQLTLQTSQGFNRNWGELIVVARPVG